jgi:glycosyltransferase involved in cell wall biosynthesis
MDYFPNEDAAEYFVKQIFPHVRTNHPTAEFLIVGASPSSRVQKLSEYDRVTVTGFVDDPKDYLEQADVLVAPMRHGAGLQNKVLEGMALGRPVVTSSLAREGINARDGDHLIVVDDPDSFAASINDLISDIDKRRQIGKSARELIEREHTWAQIGNQLRSRITEILSTHRSEDTSNQ